MQTLPREREIAAGARTCIRAIGDAHVFDIDGDAAFVGIGAAAGCGDAAAARAGGGEPLDGDAALIDGDARVEVYMRDACAFILEPAAGDFESAVDREVA